MVTSPDPIHAKAELRASIRHHRRTNPRPDLDARIAAHAADLARGATQVAAYSPMDGEPGGDALLPALTTVCRPLIPRTLPGSAMDLGWADGPLVRSPHGALEPAAGGHSFDTCDIIFVPALAATRSGARLGQGGGFYDRALPDINAPMIALLYDEEILDSLPSEPHDIRIDGFITPAGMYWCAHALAGSQTRNTTT